MFRVTACSGVFSVFYVFYLCFTCRHTYTHAHSECTEFSTLNFFRIFHSGKAALRYPHYPPIRCQRTLNTVRTAEGQWTPRFPDSFHFKGLHQSWFPSRFNTLEWSKMHQAREQQVTHREVRLHFIEETEIIFAAQPQTFCVTLRGSRFTQLWALALYWQAG